MPHPAHPTQAEALLGAGALTTVTSLMLGGDPTSAATGKLLDETINELDIWSARAGVVAAGGILSAAVRSIAHSVDKPVDEVWADMATFIMTRAAQWNLPSTGRPAQE